MRRNGAQRSSGKKACKNWHQSYSCRRLPGSAAAGVGDAEPAFCITITLFCFNRYKTAIGLGRPSPRGGSPCEWTGNLARPREFTDEKVLDAAINCFWQRGLGATSIRDLTSEMGINGPSLYNAFGDKHAVFAKALERYAERSMRSTIRDLEKALSPRNAIREFLSLLVEKSVTDPNRRGCLIVNSALEVSAHDVELGKLIASYLNEIEAFFRRSPKARAGKWRDQQEHCRSRRSAPPAWRCARAARRCAVKAGAGAARRYGASGFGAA